MARPESRGSADDSDCVSQDSHELTRGREVVGSDNDEDDDDDDDDDEIHVS